LPLTEAHIATAKQYVNNLNTRDLVTEGFHAEVAHCNCYRRERNESP